MKKILFILVVLLPLLSCAQRGRFRQLQRMGTLPEKDSLIDTDRILINDSEDNFRDKYINYSDFLRQISPDSIIAIIEEHKDTATVITNGDVNAHLLRPTSPLDTLIITPGLFTDKTDKLSEIKIISIPVEGAIFYNGLPVLANDILTVTAGNLENDFLYISDSLVYSSYADLFTFQLLFSINDNYLTEKSFFINVGSCGNEWPIPWCGKIGDIVYDSIFYCASELYFLWNIDFNPSETKLYCTDNYEPIVFQYSLATPGDIRTTTYDNKNFEPTAEITKLAGAFYSANGEKMYLGGSTSGKIYQYTLTTPGDISTAIYDNKSFSVATHVPSISDLYIGDNGAKLYVVNMSSNIYQYTLTTPGDISTAIYDNFVFPGGIYLSSIHFSHDGLTFYYNLRDDHIYQIELSTPWDMASGSSMILSRELYGGNNIRGMTFNYDGTKVFSACYSTRNIYQHSICTE